MNQKTKPDIQKALTLPKGGGAISGIGEKFQVNSVTGTGSLSVPVKTSPGRNGFGPQLNLSYDSGSGNGPFGLGWQMGTSSIVRKTQKGIPQYFDDIESDTFLLSGSEDLVPLLDKKSGNQEKVERIESGYKIYSYRPRTEGSFAKIERWLNISTKISHWRSVTGENVTSIYGSSETSRIADPDDERKIFQWYLDKTYDDKGNCTIYEYKKENQENLINRVSERNRLNNNKAFNNCYLKKIKYGNTVPVNRSTGTFEQETKWLFEIILDYGEHVDQIPSYEEKNTWPIRTDPFSFYRSGFEIRTYRLCRKILMFHHFEELGIEPYLVASTDIDYNENPVATLLKSVTYQSYESLESAAFPPLEFKYTESHIDRKIKEFDTKESEKLTGGIDGNRLRWTDLYGEGLTGILMEDQNTWWYKRNISSANNRSIPEFEEFKTVTDKPSIASLYSQGQQLIDLDGDGKLEMVVLENGLTGYYEQDKDGNWNVFKAFKDIPNIDWNDPNLKLIDVSGDGHADILLTEENCFTWYASKVKEGYDLPKSVTKALDKESGPDLVFSDSTQSIYLADMSGDGLNDIVRIRNGGISYWPNLGYAHFGSRISMDNSPRFDHNDRFDQKRIKIGDIDGSGIADILYIGSDTIHYWVNLSGNGFSEAQKISHHLPTDDLTSVSIVDLLGKGTSCIVFSNPISNEIAGRLRYIDLMLEGKPYLLSEVNNNMGAITRNYYVPSTKFYLEAEKKGKPWISKLSFPVHVLEKTELIDEVEQNIFSSKYAYHHGYYDKHEREFRGFGMVEQWDSEEFHSSTNGNNIDADSFVPPIYIKTWFHTGFYTEKSKILEQYEHEYYHGDKDHWKLPEIILPKELKLDEIREAHRALKGSMLRQEIYALDNSEKAKHPYSVIETSYKIELQQAKSNNPFASFLVLPSETLTYQYERNPADPRIQHELTLETDQYGTVLKTASIGYSRRQAAFPEQGKLYMTSEENRVIHADNETGYYRLGISVESKSFEITGIPFNNQPYKANELKDILSNAKEISFEDKPDIQNIEKRLLNHNKGTYYSENMKSELPLGKIAFHGLPYRTYEKILTPGLINLVYVDKVNNDILIEAGYIEMDKAWWRPSGIVIGDPALFFQPKEFIDPFGNTSQVEYDQYALLPIVSTDALGNSTSSIQNCRVLQASKTTDINGNSQEVKFDIRGNVIATAIIGKNGEGDTLDNPTSKLEYNLFNWKQNQQPNYSRTLAREEHKKVDAKWQESYTYSDGLGKEILTKTQAEPGLAPIRDANGSLKKDANGNLVKEIVQERWIGNGRAILNNKGKSVKKYEPYFSSTSEYESESELREYGITPITHYDPLERVTQTDMPDGTFSKSSFDSWQKAVYDSNDTVLESKWYMQKGAPDPKGPQPPEPEKRAAWLAAQHSNTPQVMHYDTLGRAFMLVEDNGISGQYKTYVELNLNNKPLRITDPKGRIVSENTYDMLGNLIYSKNPDAGDRRMLSNVIVQENEEGKEESQAFCQWDSNQHQVKIHYDVLQRPYYTSLTKDYHTCIVNLTVYGDFHPEVIPKNLNGQVYLQFDQAGSIKNHDYDFKGNLLKSSRKYAHEFKNKIDWSDLLTITDLVAIEEAVKPLLQDKEYLTETSFDALNRPDESIAPDNSIIKHNFNETNLLKKVQVKLRGAADWTSFVNNIDYDEKGQRQSIHYNNGSKTNYHYDPMNYRLVRLHTVRPSDNVNLQDLYYSFDPIGNITSVQDKAQQTVFFNNTEVKPEGQYEYDALYRLIKAEGRELAGNTKQTDEIDIPINSLPSLMNTKALRNYRQIYTYDELGNILKMVHQAEKGNWIRQYQYGSNNNQLQATSIPGDDAGLYSHKYTYDAHGNMTQMPHLKSLTWDFEDQLKEVDLIGGGKAYYVYDSAGQRVRKVIERLNGEIQERYYLGDFEFYRESKNNTPQLERETLRINDDSSNIAMVETKTLDISVNNFVIKSLFRYQLSNHLGSSTLELDEKAALISYEEYHPFGTSAYRSGRSAVEVNLKRYRYSGKERDDETGMYYYGARYYAAWLGRWTAIDPLGFVDGLNVYVFVRNNPIAYIDSGGEFIISGSILIAMGIAALIGGGTDYGIQVATNYAKKSSDPDYNENPWTDVNVLSIAISTVASGFSGGSSAYIGAVTKLPKVVKIAGILFSDVAINNIEGGIRSYVQDDYEYSFLRETALGGASSFIGQGGEFALGKVFNAFNWKLKTNYLTNNIEDLSDKLSKSYKKLLKNPPKKGRGKYSSKKSKQLKAKANSKEYMKIDTFRQYKNAIINPSFYLFNSTTIGLTTNKLYLSNLLNPIPNPSLSFFGSRFSMNPMPIEVPFYNIRPIKIKVFDFSKFNDPNMEETLNIQASRDNIKALNVPLNAPSNLHGRF